MTVEVQPWGMKPSLLRLVIIFCASMDVVGASRVLAYPTMKRCSSEVAQCSTSTSLEVVFESLERNNFEEDQSSFVHLVDLDSRDQSLVNTLGITRILLVCRRYQSVFFHKSSILLGKVGVPTYLFY